MPDTETAPLPARAADKVLTRAPYAEHGGARLRYALYMTGDDTGRMLEARAVAEALASLRPEHRRVIVETCYRGCTVAEAAAALGMPQGTVKSRTFYALKLVLQERELTP